MNEPTIIYNDLTGRRGRKKRAAGAKEECSEAAIGCRHSEEQSAAVEGPEACDQASTVEAGVGEVMVKVLRTFGAAIGQ
jgi:hypothetical protein